MNIDDVRIKFDAKWLSVIKPFKAVHDIRYYLNGFSVEKASQGGVYIVACDGHSLVAIYDKLGECNSDEHVILTAPPELFVKGRQRMEGGLPMHVVVSGKRLSLASDFGMECSNMEHYVQPGDCHVEGKFPDWRKVLPRWNKLKPGAMREGKNGINATYLARMAELTKGGKYQGVNFWQEDDNSALVVQIPRLPEVLVVIMPMRETFVGMVEQYERMGLSHIKVAGEVAETVPETATA